MTERCPPPPPRTWIHFSHKAARSIGIVTAIRVVVQVDLALGGSVQLNSKRAVALVMARNVEGEEVEASCPSLYCVYACARVVPESEP